ncbi:hypothetical protein PMW_195 [Pseudomonas phage phiPMW]|uniref:Uncharacterized protein n=1 Tax=Pseudomonas phage phiPMW TaxID=1815582 RepID=A0A1S5R1M7_9CAUD|nr:hypothetical protein FDG97_gp155 [Pseudomonas phage phiPMW]ANA49320.1 hypothetical protein PMW_195 [Pseudomonas phage phiPMW]
MDKKFLDGLWETRGDHWEEVDDDGSWLDCCKCKTQPRIWVYNNGRHAKCICYGPYDNGPVRVESILSYVHRTDKGAIGYPWDSLRTTWNKFSQDGIERNKLPEGQW